MNAFEILGVPETAEDEAILNAYLLSVRECPPEKDPHHFEKVRAAYEAICNERQRIQYQLLHHSPMDVETVIQAILNAKQSQKIHLTEKQLKKCLLESLSVIQ